MSWFGKKSSIELKTGESVTIKAAGASEPQPTGPTWESVTAKLETLAAQAEHEARAKAPELMLSFLKHLDDDRAKFKFTAKRYGVFLALDLVRGINPEKDHRYTVMVTLGQLKSIQVVQGRAPDTEGILTFDYHGSKSEPLMMMMLFGYGDRQSCSGLQQEWVVTSKYEELPASMPLTGFCDAYMPRVTHTNSFGCIQYNIKRHGYGFPRPSNDDMIYLNGTDVILRAPFGKGQEVYDTILAAGLSDGEKAKR